MANPWCISTVLTVLVMFRTPAHLPQQQRCGLATTGGQTSFQGSQPFMDASGRLRGDFHMSYNLQADGPLKALVDET